MGRAFIICKESNVFVPVKGANGMVANHRYCSSCGGANSPDDATCFACGQSLKTTLPLPAEPTIANRLLKERYRILAEVGKGGFAIVYKAQDTQFGNQLVAIKEIRLSGLRPHEVITATEAYNREMLLLSDLRHANLPRIYDHFADAECWYLIMDFIEGKTLEQYLDEMGETCFPIEEVLNIAIQLCTVLDYLHTRQPRIIFRDLKPTNIMLTRDGQLFLIDFGIARRFKPGQAKDTIPFGSPGYAPPEQYGKAQTTPSADIYSLGAILHQLLSGSDPTQTPFNFAPLQWQDQPLLARLETLVLQMLQMDPNSRPDNIAVVKQQLQDIAAQWTNRYKGGLQAQIPRSHKYQPTGIAWQDNTTASPGSTPVAAAGQMILLRQPASTAGASFVVPGRVMPGSAPIPMPQRNGAAIASLVLGILSYCLSPMLCVIAPVLFFISPFRFFFLAVLVLLVILMPILAAIFGHIGLHRVRKHANLKSSKGMAVAGMALGYVFIALFIAFPLLIILISFFS
jgi:serine/threonine protein kinase